MAWVEHHQRPRIAALRLRPVGARQIGAGGAAVDRDFVQERLAVGLSQIEHQPCRRAIGRVDDEGLLDSRRLGEIENQTRAALHHEPEAERLDQPAPGLAGFRRQLEYHLRDVDDDAIGIGERESVKLDLAAEIHDEAGLRFVAAETHIGRDRKRIG